VGDGACTARVGFWRSWGGLYLPMLLVAEGLFLTFCHLDKTVDLPEPAFLIGITGMVLLGSLAMTGFGFLFLDFLIDASGLQRNYLFFTKTIGWDEISGVRWCGPGFCRLVRRRAPGSDPLQLNVPFWLPSPWLVRNRREVRAAIEKFAPPGNPLRTFF
jgi:hypothetical protein